MRSDRRLTLFLLTSLSLGWSATATSQTLSTRRVASGLVNPLWAGAPAGDDRIFVVEKRGIVKVVEKGVVGTFLSITTKVSTGSEQGLLGFAFHPDYATNGTFFLDYTDTFGDTVVSRWQVSASDPNVADPTSESVILTQFQPATNHNAGAITFGLDGYFYITFGDGGFGADCNAQDLGTWLGKILRIDVDSGSPYAVPSDNPFVGVAGALPEIWHLGLRNPFRMSIDRLTGDMYFGDVGEGAREEISFAAAGVGGLNFGWRVLEGTNCRGNGPCTPAPACTSPTYTPPLTQLVHTGGTGPLAIIGGYVYRGCMIPGLQGTYFYADYNDDKIRSFEYDPSTGILSNPQDRTAELEPPGTPTIRNIASFGEDGSGELLIVDHSAAGEVFKVVPSTAVAATSVDRNGSGVNALCYTTQSLPVIGSLWRAEIDVAGHPGATVAGVAWYDHPLAGIMVSGGELLVDITQTNLFTTVAGATGNPVTFAAAIPCDASLGGLLAYSQGFILGGAGWELCNANDLTLGHF